MPSEQYEKLADFQTMYAMLKVHSANQAKEIERLQERLANPPADAALADAIKLACNYYRQAGRVGTTSQTLAKQHEAAADKIIAEALRVRAVPEGCKHENRTSNYNHLSCNSCGAFMTDSQWGAASNKWFPSKAAAMLAASKSEEGKL